MPTDLSRPRGLGELRDPSALLEQRVDRLRRQDDLTLGPANGSVCADLLWPCQCLQPRHVQFEG